MAIAQYTLDGKLLNTFESMKEASRKTGVPFSSINNCVNSRTKHGRGYFWTKIKDNEIAKPMLSRKLEYYEEYPEFALDDAWEKLCYAIVCQAVEDYKVALEDGDEDEQEDLLDFFYSEFVEVTTGLNPDDLVYQIKRIHKKETVSL